MEIYLLLTACTDHGCLLSNVSCINLVVHVFRCTSARCNMHMNNRGSVGAVRDLVKRWCQFTDLHDGAAVSLRVVDAERDEVLALDAGAVLVVDPHVLPLEAELEEFTLGDGNFHLRMFTHHLCLYDVIITCRRANTTVIPGELQVHNIITTSHWKWMNSIHVYLFYFWHHFKYLTVSPPVLVGNSGQPHRSPPFSSSQVKFVQISPAQGS